MMSSTTCPHCSKNYSNNTSRNRHIKLTHPDKIQRKEKNSLIHCPLCTDADRPSISTYAALMQHLQDTHNIKNLEEEKLTFENSADFEKWRQLEKRNLDYVKTKMCRGKYKTSICYSCNRSNTYGFKSNCTKYLKKKGGSIKINGICPSRIKADFYSEGKVEVRFVETHVGHEQELRSRRLTPEEQKEIAEKLKAGVSWDKIIRDAQNEGHGKLERINLLRRDDLQYQIKKIGIKRYEDPNDKANSKKALETEETNKWKIIVDTERPNSNSVKDRIIAKAHKNAELENWSDDVKMIEFGKFEVKSDENSYSVVYGDVDTCDCGNLLCRICEICRHKYVCDCADYTVRDIMCKHVHMVCLHEKRVLVESAVDAEVKKEADKYFCVEEFVEEQLIEEQYQDSNNPEEQIDDKTYKDIFFQDLSNEMNTLNITEFKELSAQLMKILRQFQADASTKRKAEKQTYDLQTQKKQRKE